ncbi:MAG: rod shape-determining protein MreD [Epulopiscium sp.]|nr:rod shape-determining protein MreD [Candidatus Epulonipiscium sp.]
MRILVISLLLLSYLILQPTYIQYLRIMGVVPNLAVMIIVSFALLRGSVEGAIIGFSIGLLQDVFFGRGIGFQALIGMFIGYVCGIPSQKYYRENYILPFFLIIVSTFAQGMCTYVFTFLIRGRTNFLFFFNRIIIPEVVYTAALSLLIYRLIYGINEKIEARERLRRKHFS